MADNMRVSSGLLAVVIMSGMFLGVVGLAGDAAAQQVTLQTSAHSFDDRFFGEAVLQVIVKDPDADDDNAVEEIQVNIEADPDSGSSTTESFLVPETSDSSGKFEFFLVHAAATVIGAEDLDPVNIQGVEGDGNCVTDCALLLTFGPGGDLNVQSDLYEKVTFEFTAGNAKAEAGYEQVAGNLVLDRDSYGTNSYVYVSIADQDANLNPFERDEFIVDSDDLPNNDLLELGGGSFVEVPMVFRETGTNTAVFESRYRLGESIIADSESLALTLHEKANYNATLAAPENDSNNTDGISFTVGNADGTIDIGGGQGTALTWDPILGTDRESYALGESVNVTILDKDANGDPDVADVIQLQVSSGGNQIEISALETGENTGAFLASITLANETDAQSAKIVPGGFAVITYTDQRPVDYFEKVQAGQNAEKEFTIEVDVELPIKTGVESTDVTAPVIKTVSGGTDGFRIGSSLTLSTTILNNNEIERPFVAIVEVRDSSGVTVFLALQSGTLQPTGSSDIGVLWQPEDAGTFEIRTFAITDITGEVELLSSPAVSKITVDQT